MHYLRKTAERIGLVNKAVPLEMLDKEVRQMAEKIAASSAISLKMIKKGLQMARGEVSLEALLDFEIEACLICVSTKERQESLKDFEDRKRTGYWMLDTGCWILDAGYWMLDAGCEVLDGVSRCQVSAHPLARKATGQIEKETNEHRTLNVQRRIMYSVNLNKIASNTRPKRLRCASEFTLRNSTRLSRSTLSSRPKGSLQAAVQLF